MLIDLVPLPCTVPSLGLSFHWIVSLCRVFELVVIIFSLADLVQSYSCQIQPLVWRLQNSTFNDVVGINRGVTCELPGNQVVGLRPTTCHNVSWIRNSGDCTGNTTDIIVCEGESGSLFDPSVSGFTREVDSVFDSHIPFIDPDPFNARVIKGEALAQFDGGPNMSIPLVVWSEDFGSQTPNKSFIAFGPESSILQRLLDGSFIPSKVLGIFYGSRSVSNPTDGEIVMGGWNQARVAGPWYNFTIAAYPISISCPLTVNVTGVILNNDQGSFPILNPGESVVGCVDFLQNAFTFPDLMFSRWANLTDHPGTNNTAEPPFDNQTYLASNEHLIQTLTIQLDGGFSTIVPHYELVVPDRGSLLSGQGDYTIINNSRIQSAVTAGMSDYGINFGMLLGGVFSSGVYILVDYENGTFSMAAANLNPNASDIRTVCSLNTSLPINPNGTTGSNSSSNGSSGNGLGVGTDIGIAFGALGAFLAMIGTYFAWHQYIYVRRKERWRRASEASTTAAQTPAQLTPMLLANDSVQVPKLVHQPTLPQNPEGSVQQALPNDRPVDSRTNGAERQGS